MNHQELLADFRGGSSSESSPATSDSFEAGHYCDQIGEEMTEYSPLSIADGQPAFIVVEHQPTAMRPYWSYATAGVSLWEQRCGGGLIVGGSRCGFDGSGPARLVQNAMTIIHLGAISFSAVKQIRLEQFVSGLANKGPTHRHMLSETTVSEGEPRVGFFGYSQERSQPVADVLVVLGRQLLLLEENDIPYKTYDTVTLSGLGHIPTKRM